VDATPIAPGEVVGGAISANTDGASAPGLRLETVQPHVSECTTENIVSHGGPLVVTPRVNLVFWGNFDPGQADEITSNWQVLANTPAFYNRMAEYGINNGTFGQRIDIPDGVSGRHADCAFVGGLASWLGAAGVSPSDDDVYLIFLPSDTSNQNNVDDKAKGHHGSYARGFRGTDEQYDRSTGTCYEPSSGTTYDLKINGDIPNLRYAIDRYYSDMALVMTVSTHEAAETFGNPDGRGVGELCDMCEGHTAENNYHFWSYINGIRVSKTWSQNACRCVGERDLNNLNLYHENSVPTVFRPSNASFYPLGSRFRFPVGKSTSIPFVFDHDGDGIPDYAAYTDQSSGRITTRLSTPPYPMKNYTFGTTGDLVVPGDYDGDSYSDLAVWRPSTGEWIVRFGDQTESTVQWGTTGDIPVPGDYDGDYITDYAVIRPSEDRLYVILSSTGAGMYYVWHAYQDGDIPTPGDFNGDGLTDFAFWRPSNGYFYVWYFGTSTSYNIHWGHNGDIPVVSDYDGDWLSDMAFYRPEESSFYIYYSTTGKSDPIQWGTTGDIPIKSFTITGGF